MQVLNVRGKDSRGPRVTPTSLLLTEAYGKREPVRGGKIALGGTRMKVIHSIRKLIKLQGLKWDNGIV